MNMNADKIIDLDDVVTHLRTARDCMCEEGITLDVGLRAAVDFPGVDWDMFAGDMVNTCCYPLAGYRYAIASVSCEDTDADLMDTARRMIARVSGGECR